MLSLPFNYEMIQCLRDTPYIRYTHSFVTLSIGSLNNWKNCRTKDMDVDSEVGDASCGGSSQSKEAEEFSNVEVGSKVVVGTDTDNVESSFVSW